MTPTQHLDAPAPEREEPPTDDCYANIRSAVRGLDADAIAHQLPNLAETVASQSSGDPPTLQWIIGVSFSRNDTLLDYRLDRLVEADGLDRPRYETLKPAVTTNHLYVTFEYPPDPYFDAPALRGALLGAIERELTSYRVPDAGPGENGDHTRSNSWLDQLCQFVGAL